MNVAVSAVDVYFTRMATKMLRADPATIAKAHGLRFLDEVPKPTVGGVVTLAVDVLAAILARINASGPDDSEPDGVRSILDCFERMAGDYETVPRVQYLQAVFDKGRADQEVNHLVNQNESLYGLALDCVTSLNRQLARTEQRLRAAKKNLDDE